MSSIIKKLLKELESLGVLDVETDDRGAFGFKAFGYKMPENKEVDAQGSTEIEALKNLIKEVSA